MTSDFDKLAEKIKSTNPINPILRDRNRDTQLKFLSDKKTEELRKKLKLMLKILNIVMNG